MTVEKVRTVLSNYESEFVRPTVKAMALDVQIMLCSDPQLMENSMLNVSASKQRGPNSAAMKLKVDFKNMKIGE